ncbi:MAG: hypothetical protein K5890_07840 [Bacteroidales bacterium]|nr:hypothetical protein [Bacteroidales bacterium]
MQLFDNRVGNAIGYAVIFFLLPFFVAGVACVVGKWRWPSRVYLLPMSCLSKRCRPCQT